MALTDTAIRNLKSQNGPYKKSNRAGLYLLVKPNGSKLWQRGYRFAGKQKTISFGAYPLITMAMARQANTEASRLLQQGVDPLEDRKAEKRAAASARTLGEVGDYVPVASAARGKLNKVRQRTLLAALAYLEFLLAGVAWMLVPGLVGGVRVLHAGGRSHLRTGLF